MSERSAGATGLTSQYSAQVAGDLERNRREQERIGKEIEALQAQLAGLHHDRAVLENMRQVLGLQSVQQAAVPEPVGADTLAVMPSPRADAASGTGTEGATDIQGASEAVPPAESERHTRDAPVDPRSPRVVPPTLVELVRAHLRAQAEPRSALEIATELARRHPDRTVKKTVVRTTLEALVAKAQAQRIKQGTSVFYTAAGSHGPGSGLPAGPKSF
uniref:hypothetical protein n=1 Tax=Streptomyces corallincola TaxID=2851888 RepID=UPI0027E37A3E|nr:hypothetical protein [Streptomyces corallincola]